LAFEGIRRRWRRRELELRVREERKEGKKARKGRKE
jgi:hypothetical protein